MYYEKVLWIKVYKSLIIKEKDATFYLQRIFYEMTFSKRH